MKIAIFENLHDTKDSKDRVHSLKFQDLQKLEHTATEDKKDVKLFALHDGESAKKEAISEVYGLVLDFDDCQEEALKANRAIANRWENYYYTTHSHDPENGKSKARLVIPFLYAIAVEDWEKTFDRVVAIAGFSDYDPRSRDVARRYFFPSCPPDRLSSAEAVYSQGPRLDPQAIKSSRESLPADTAYDQSLLDFLIASDSPELSELASLASLGEPLAPDGAREKALFSLALGLVKVFPDVDGEKFANLISKSLQETAMVGDGRETLDQIKSKLCRKIEDRKIYLKDAELEKQEKRKESEELLDRLASDQQTTRRGLLSRWIANIGGNFWFLGERGYSGPFNGPCVVSAAEQELAPYVESAGIELFTENSKGESRPKMPNVLVSDYGTVCEEIAYTQVGESRIELGEKTTLIHRIHRQREDVQAKRHPEVDKWIDLFAGDQADNVRQWLAYAPRLHTVCAALAIVGKANVGKSAMAIGVSRLWSDSAPLSKEATARFNDYRRSPLVFWDEGLAKNNRGEYDIDLFRRIVQERVHTIELKGQNLQTFHGCLRVIIAANTLPELGFSARVTPQAASAIAERLLLVEANPRASGWLANNFHNGVCFGKLFAEKDWIAEHALWLSQQLPDVSDLRFKIDTRSRKLRGLALAKGASGQILRGVVDDLGMGGSHYSKTEDGSVLIGPVAAKFCDKIAQGDASRSDFLLATMQDLAELTTGGHFKISIDDLECYLEHIPRLSIPDFRRIVEALKVTELRKKEK